MEQESSIPASRPARHPFRCSTPAHWV